MWRSDNYFGPDKIFFPQKSSSIVVTSFSLADISWCETCLCSRSWTRVSTVTMASRRRTGSRWDECKLLCLIDQEPFDWWNQCRQVTWFELWPRAGVDLLCSSAAGSESSSRTSAETRKPATTSLTAHRLESRDVVTREPQIYGHNKMKHVALMPHHFCVYEYIRSVKNLHQIHIYIYKYILNILVIGPWIEVADIRDCMKVTWVDIW